MKADRALEQHIAVFGESGSGKTVLLSSFYGPTQEDGFGERNHFNVVADDAGQRNTLYRNYLGMRNSARAPEPTRQRSRPYSFSVRMAEAKEAQKSQKKAPFDTLRLVWHDYPGEWFEQEVSGEEVERRVDGFRSLLGSDVALLLVDAQRLIDNVGQEEAYLKSLFTNYRLGIEALKDEILVDGKPLEVFPRIWIVALSKCDLMPDLDVRGLEELVIEKAGGKLDRLRQTLASMVQAPSALAVGEDFLLLSSAKFSPGEIALTERVGLDLILPIAAMLPIERHLRWSDARELPPKIAQGFLDNALVVAEILNGFLAVLIKGARGRVRALLVAARVALNRDALETFVGMGQKKLEEYRDAALAKHEYLTALFLRFRIDLEEAEKAKILLRSLR